MTTAIITQDAKIQIIVVNTYLNMIVRMNLAIGCHLIVAVINKKIVWLHIHSQLVKSIMVIKQHA
jgi:hypothetical protein